MYRMGLTFLTLTMLPRDRRIKTGQWVRQEVSRETENVQNTEGPFKSLIPCAPAWLNHGADFQIRVRISALPLTIEAVWPWAGYLISLSFNFIIT